MIRIGRLGLATALLVSAAALPGWADSIPQLDIEPSCQAAQGAAQVIGRDGDNCRADEKNAKEILSRDWDKFSIADKHHCTSLVTTGGPPSYVELMSCLELSRDARQIVQERSRRSAGQSAPAGETTGAGTVATPSR